MMMLPTIHLNGTSREELQRQIEAAYSAVIRAIAAVENASPNGRDYYPQGPQAIGAAMGEHVSRLERLGDISAELLEIYQALDA